MVYVSGVGISQPAADEPTPSLEELVFEASRRALADAALSRDDIDGVCLAASDQLDGRAISSMHVAGPAGARLKDEIKVADDGSLAFAAAVTRIQSGVSRHVLAVSWTKPDASDTGRALSVNPEPIFTRPFGCIPGWGRRCAPKASSTRRAPRLIASTRGRTAGGHYPARSGWPSPCGARTCRSRRSGRWPSCSPRNPARLLFADSPGTDDAAHRAWRPFGVPP